MRFTEEVKNKIVEVSEGYPYFVQLVGKECVAKANQVNNTVIDLNFYQTVLDDIKRGKTTSAPSTFRSTQKQAQFPKSGTSDRAKFTIKVRFPLPILTDTKPSPVTLRTSMMLV